MKKVFGKIWLVWFGFWFVSIFLILYPFLFILLQSPKTYRQADKLRKIWGKSSSYLGLMIPQITYEKPLNPKGQYVICPNHISYIDIVSAGSFFPTFNFFMAKMELSKLPLFNIWFKTIDVPVKRESLRSAHGAFVDAAKKLDEGATLIIFPEGRIPDDAPNLHKFKPGAFKLAIEKKIPIVPVTFLDNIDRLNIVDWTCTPGKMRIHVHAPIETVNLSIDDVQTLQDQVYSIIHNKLVESKII
jgi:1-acyl-sn-glycerol-3-phosphate acyltransferase